MLTTIANPLCLFWLCSWFAIQK